MIKQPLLKQANRGLQSSKTMTLPAPTAGWNVRDPLAAMSPKYASILENFFPSPYEVTVRKGSASHVTGFTTEAPKTLFSWNGTTTSKMFAATDDGIYDITASGAVGASVTSLTSGRCIATNFTTAGGHYLITVNGVDKLKLFDGTTWLDIDSASTPAITGLVTTSLNFVTPFKHRLWFVQASSMSAWYLSTVSIAGALTEFPIGQIFSRGGHLVSIANWTIDGGDGIDDYAVFITSEGELALYKGSDPASSTTFSLVGVYYVGEPLTNRCFLRYGGDLLVTTKQGIFPLSKVLQSSTIDRTTAITSKIDAAFSQVVELYGNNPNWVMQLYPTAGFLLINIPITDSYSQQYVMNTVTGAWTCFTGWSAADWTLFNGELYFAATTSIIKAWTGVSDSGANIVARCQQAYSNFRYPAQEKHFKLFRPALQISGTVTAQYSFDTDYQRNDFSSEISFPQAPGGIWDTSLWDSAIWGEGFSPVNNWSTIFADPCFAAAFRLQVATNSAILKWTGTDFVFQLGGVL